MGPFVCMHQNPIRLKQEFAVKKVRVYFLGSGPCPERGDLMLKDLVPQGFLRAGLCGGNIINHGD